MSEYTPSRQTIENLEELRRYLEQELTQIARTLAELEVRIKALEDAP